MKVIRAKVLGFCMGVRRAVDMAEGELRAAVGSGAGGRVCTMGPLIHNPQVLESLQRQGAEILNEDKLPENLTGATVIIRAHGISPALEDELKKRGARVADATCPRVKASQLKARSLTKEGYTLFLAGEKKHGEVIGIQGYATGTPRHTPNCIVVADPDEAEKAAETLFHSNPGVKTALIGQTTISAEEYCTIGEGIKKFFPALEIIDTICGATRDRQEALRELCGAVDAVIVAGGRSSANTRRLLFIACEQGKPAWLVESPEEIPPEIALFETVGLCAGASTPDETIGIIEKALLALRPGE
ncbi:4-hydroxy-3-methylbut-2-enyl diphosphate reductase [Spirochaetia bacterium]|nr:4-hydroxy-3-methylbut-2-enyl diphosphate reductase [Spirochaetia bacterium]